MRKKERAREKERDRERERERNREREMSEHGRAASGRRAVITLRVYCDPLAPSGRGRHIYPLCRRYG